jgi:hypothetical protein
MMTFHLRVGATILPEVEEDYDEFSYRQAEKPTESAC